MISLSTEDISVIDTYKSGPRSAPSIGTEESVRTRQEQGKNLAKTKKEPGNSEMSTTAHMWLLARGFWLLALRWSKRFCARYYQEFNVLSSIGRVLCQVRFCARYYQKFNVLRSNGSIGRIGSIR